VLTVYAHGNGQAFAARERDVHARVCDTGQQVLPAWVDAPIREALVTARPPPDGRASRCRPADPVGARTAVSTTDVFPQRLAATRTAPNPPWPSTPCPATAQVPVTALRRPFRQLTLCLPPATAIARRDFPRAAMSWLPQCRRGRRTGTHRSPWATRPAAGRDRQQRGPAADRAAAITQLRGGVGETERVES
jgi:hypothetical protein